MNGHLLCLNRELLCSEKSLMAQSPRALFTSSVSVFHRQCTSPSFSLNLSNSSYVPCNTASCHSWKLTSLALGHQGDINLSFTFSQSKEELKPISSSMKPSSSCFQCLTIPEIWKCASAASPIKITQYMTRMSCSNNQRHTDVWVWD